MWENEYILILIKTIYTDIQFLAINIDFLFILNIDLKKKVIYND